MSDKYTDLTVHKRMISWSIVTPKNRSPYIRENLNQVKCSKSMASIRAAEELISPYDEDVTCPDCLAELKGRERGNDDIMRDAAYLNKLRKGFQDLAEERRYA